jgi:hypothetical protein
MSADLFQHDRPLLRGTGVLAATTLALALLAGCGDAEEEPGSGGETSETADDTATDTEEMTMTPAPPDDSAATELPTGDVPADIAESEEVQAAIADLAERQGVEESEITVAGFREVTWRDGSIGCPEPGMMYTQALVPGRQLVLAIDNDLYAYNAADDGEFTFCAKPQDPAPTGSSGSSGR